MSNFEDPAYKDDSIDSLDRSIAQTYEIVDMGHASLAELEGQKERLIKMTGDVDHIDEEVTVAGFAINRIRRGLRNKKYVCGGIIILLTVAIGVLLYFRLRHVL